jgi:hypothetical protein
LCPRPVCADAKTLRVFSVEGGDNAQISLGNYIPKAFSEILAQAQKPSIPGRIVLKTDFSAHREMHDSAKIFVF